MFDISFYPKDASYGDAFEEVRLSLRNQNEMLKHLHYHWSRWEWMFARASFEEADLQNIVMFKKDKELKGLITFEDELGVYFLIYEDDLSLKKTMIDHIKKNSFLKNLIIPDDEEMIKLLSDEGFKMTDWKDPVARFSLDCVDVETVSGYDFVTLEEDYRLEEIHRVLWRGFNHGDDVVMSEKNLKERHHMTSSPHFRKAYTHVAKYQNHFVSYVGVWYEKGTKTALIEPVATVPEHRRKGLAKALIYKAIKRVKQDGASDVFVGSDRTFYQNMGFIPFAYGIQMKKTEHENPKIQLIESKQ
ncbi:MAG: GNAT family N-acetyltransferase [Acholeplasmataceae bacterium]|nr:GNAT family N-acetyltransferase [Acholeplasmataceae bacterium]